MNHGLLDSADAFIINFKDKAPAFVAAEQGYDVWLGNNRGNKYSMLHTTLDAEKDSKYWRYSFVEMSKYDLPAFISYIRDNTGMLAHEKMTYLAHSQGTIQMFYKLATNKKFAQDNFNLYVGLAPMARLSKTSQIPGAVLKAYVALQPELEFLGVHSVFGVDFVSKTISRGCGVFTSVCEYLTYFFCTNTIDPVNYEKFRVYMGHYPSGSSLQSLVHLGQFVEHGKFKEYDWGPKTNLKKYGQIDPPTLSFSGVTKEELPMALYVGKDDLVAQVEDSHWLRDQVKDALVDYQELKGGHVQFFVNKDASFFTKNIMTQIRKFNPV